MVREIKFKAWDTRNKCMEEIDGCHLYMADGKVYEVYESSYAYQSYMEKKDVSDRYIPLQYTGLHDKNGQEIYAGYIYDIGICTKIIRPDYFIEDTYELMKMLEDNARIEVIGNIYDNPELLK